MLILLPSEKKGRGWTSRYRENPTPSNSNGYVRVDSALTNSEHLGATRWAYALSCRLTILHGYRFGVLHFSLGTTFYTICLHTLTSCPLLKRKLMPLCPSMARQHPLAFYLACRNWGNSWIRLLTCPPTDLLNRLPVVSQGLGQQKGSCPSSSDRQVNLSSLLDVGLLLKDRLEW